MTATAPARAAVDPRPARGAAGRRAMQVVLFLGGLLALGLLAGGRAEAQERPEPGLLTASVADAAPESAEPGAAARAAVEPSARRTADQVVRRPVARPVAEPVIKQVDRPVRQQSTQQQTAQQRSAQPRTVPRAPAQKAPAEPVVESAAELAAEPAAPAHALARDGVLVGAGDTVDRVAGEVRPLVPSLPVLPPLFSVLPVPCGEPAAPGAPSASVPDTGRGAGGGAATPGGAGADASAELAAGRDRGIADPGSAPAVPDGSGAPDAGHAQGSEPAPAPGRAPVGPYGDLGRTAVADVQGPRGGDLHAVRTPGGPYTALVRGAGLPATAAPVSDRSGEILEFPG
ncbi:hypothetical protein [Streptomyces anulatus]|uniref:hypothetical protein n=2 Tax=Streptomyces TaxID=1883 RepID=UPI0032515B04|nr:hypothetical protein OH791_13975 [Streptomyces anulatus]